MDFTQNLTVLRASHGVDFDASVEYEGGERFLLAHLFNGKAFAEVACQDLGHVRRYLSAEAADRENPNPLPVLLIDLADEGAVMPILYNPVDGVDLDAGYRMPLNATAADLEYEFERVI